jgi:hypothetical protein
VKNSTRALIVAVIPLAAVQAVFFAMLLLKSQYASSQLALPSPDRVLVLYVVQLAIDTVLLFGGHLVLRERAVSSRLAYALMGGAMAAAGYTIVLRNGLLVSPPESGSAITLGLLPTFAGMMAGFLYCQFAGLAPAKAWPRFSAEGLRASFTFNGPVRVRTSVAATAIAAVIPAALTAILSFTFLTVFLPQNVAPAGVAPIFFAALPAQIFLMTLTLTIVPSAILVVCTHHIARALHRSGGLEYAAIGGLLAAFCGVVVAPFTPFTSITFLLVPGIAYGAIMGALYRRFAGIEPVPLPEPVIVTDESTLVPANHSSRQEHSVVFTDRRTIALRRVGRQTSEDTHEDFRRASSRRIDCWGRRALVSFQSRHRYRYGEAAAAECCAPDVQTSPVAVSSKAVALAM